jgi:hypothetical protein
VTAAACVANTALTHIWIWKFIDLQRKYKYLKPKMKRKLIGDRFLFFPPLSDGRWRMFLLRYLYILSHLSKNVVLINFLLFCFLLGQSASQLVGVSIFWARRRLGLTCWRIHWLDIDQWSVPYRPFVMHSQSRVNTIVTGVQLIYKCG